jgi:hypothetical protein
MRMMHTSREAKDVVSSHINISKMYIIFYASQYTDLCFYFILLLQIPVIRIWNSIYHDVKHKKQGSVR